jgi:hypothetical protein
VLLVAAAGIYVAIQYYQKVSTQNAVAVVTVDGVEAMWILEDGSIQYSDGFEEYTR